MKRKIIAAVLVLLSAGLAWQTFAMSEKARIEECVNGCGLVHKQCYHVVSKKDQNGATEVELKEELAACDKALEACIRKCHE